MDTRQAAEHLRFFQELGVTGISRDSRWRERQRELPVVQSEAASATVAVAQPLRIFTLREIREDIGECTRCKLHTLGRSQVVFGAGNPSADLMFVGEAPGADEDAQGVPFVGRAGQLLTKMIEAMGFAREDVYIANVIKCRPPENRNPDPDEVLSCEPFLFRQIQTIQPLVIVALGAFAAKALLKSEQPISKLRGQVHDYQGAKLIPTFHPSYLLRSPGQKKYAWDDLKRALSLMGRTGPRGAGDGTA
jgi:DNA polymerase